MTEIDKLTGSKKVTVQIADGELSAAVQSLPLSKMDLWLNAQNDEREMIHLATGLERESIDALPLESQEILLKEAEEMNASFFERFVTRRLQRAQRLDGYRASVKSVSE